MCIGLRTGLKASLPYSSHVICHMAYLPKASSISSLRYLSYSDHPSCRDTRCGQALSILCYAFLFPSQGDRTQRPHHQGQVCSRRWYTRDNSSCLIYPSSLLHAQSVCGSSVVVLPYKLYLSAVASDLLPTAILLSVCGSSSIGSNLQPCQLFSLQAFAL